MWHSDLDFIFNRDDSQKLSAGTSTNWYLRPQYFNLILSLVSISVRYASVFWACSRSFSFIFSLLMMLSSFHVLLDYSTMSILVRVAYNPDFVSQSLRITSMSPYSIMGVSLIGSSVVLISSWSVFEFGFQQFVEAIQHYRHCLLIQSRNEEKNVLKLNTSNKRNLYLRGYLPHLCAICGAVIGIGMKIPIFYSGIDILYKNTADPITLTNLMIAVLFFSTWLIAWFGFSLKQTWKFTLSNSSRTISDTSSATTTLQPPRKKSSDHINQVYSCFQNLGDSAHQTILQRREFFVEEEDLCDNAACTNYVYLQSAANPAHMKLPIHGESPLIASFIENPDPKNAISGSESSYESATNIRNQQMINVDQHTGKFQNIHQFGVPTYSEDNSRSDYITLQNESSFGGTRKVENYFSTEPVTIMATENDSARRFDIVTQQQQTNTVSLNRQNSNKKRTYGQRVTFKDSKSQDVTDCSPNNSEQSYNNLTSSDSGIDSSSKKPRNSQSIQVRNNFVDHTDTAHRVSIRPSASFTNNKCIPTLMYVSQSMDTIQCSVGSSTVIQGSSNLHSHNRLTEDMRAIDSDGHSMSNISEDGQEARLCSQV